MIIPVGTHLLLEPIKDAEKTEGGLYIPDSLREEPDKGRILSVGTGVQEPKLAEGTIVLFRKGLGNSIKKDGKEYLLLPLKEVIGILKVEE